MGVVINRSIARWVRIHVLAVRTIYEITGFVLLLLLLIIAVVERFKL
jgi:uncharacterized membrane protein YdcZ (DUF606 family)